MANYTVTTLLEGVAETLGEGPFWQPDTETLLFVSIHDGKVHIWNAQTQLKEFVQVGKPGEDVGFVIPCEKGGFLVGVDRKIVHMDWNAGELQLRTIHEVEQGEPTRFNDAKCDPAGRLVAGTMSLGKEPGVIEKPNSGSLYGLDDKAQLKVFDSGFSISNGLAWHGDKMYFVESIRRQIFAYDWDSENFSASNRQVVVDYKNLPGSEEFGMPDGMTVDANGNLWVCCFFGSRILHIDPQSGKLLDQIKLPAANITSCCFGGPNMDELFVTSARQSTSNPLAGSVFRVSGLGVKGALSVPFKGALP